MGRTALTLLPLVLAVVAACGEGAATTTSTAATATSTIAPTTTTSTTTTSTTTTTPPATTTTVVHPNRLKGVWVAPNHAVYITFDGEGTHYVSYLNGEPFDFGPYLLEGNVLTLISGEGQEVCRDGSIGVYEIEIPSEVKELRARLVSDNCSERTRAMTSAPLRWWSPLP